MREVGEAAGCQLLAEQRAQQRRRAVDDVQALAVDPVGQPRSVEKSLPAGRRTHRAAHRQRHEGVAQESVESGRGELAHPHPFLQAEGVDLPADEVIDRLEAAGDPLGPPGGSGGEIDVAEVVRAERLGALAGRPAAAGVQRLLLAAEEDDARRRPLGAQQLLHRRQVQRMDQPPARPRLGDQRFQPRRRGVAVERHEGAAGLEHAGDGDQHVGGAADKNVHQVAPRGAGRAQPPGQPAGLRRELAIGHLPGLPADRRMAGEAPRRRVEHVMHRFMRHCQSSRCAPPFMSRSPR